MSASAQNVDFSNVKDGGSFNRRRIPAGDYLATITKIEDAKAKDDTFQYLVSIKINKNPSSVFPYYCKLQENQLWKLRNLLIAGGLTVPKRRFKVDPNKLIGKVIGVTVEDDEYDGKEQSNIAGVFPAAELTDLGDDDSGSDDGEDEPTEDDSDLGDLEEPAADEVEETEVDEETTEDELAGLDRAALKAQLKTFDPAFVAKKSQTDDDLRELLRNAIDDAAKDSGSEDEEDEDEVEETPAPAVKKRAAKPAATVSDDELEELNIDDI